MMLYLHGLGHFHPENVITNRFLEDLDIGTSEEWILERVGIRTRRTVLPLDYIAATKNSDPAAAFEASLYGNAQMGAAAARKALERARLSPADIGLVVAGNSSPGYASPAEATLVAAELGISAPCFDLTSACTTFGVQIHFLRCMRPEALPKFALVVNPENVTRSIDYSDRTAAVLFGDATTAAVVSAVEPSRLRIVSSEVSSDPANWDKIVIPRMGHFRQEGHAVQGFAIRKTTDMLRRLHAAYAGKDGNRFLFVGHQANLGMLATVCERTGIPAECHWHNVAEYGNTACAGVPSVLSQHWDDLRDGDRIGIAIVGAGLTWTNMMILVNGHDDL